MQIMQSIIITKYGDDNHILDKSTNSYTQRQVPLLSNLLYIKHKLTITDMKHVTDLHISFCRNLLLSTWKSHEKKP